MAYKGQGKVKGKCRFCPEIFRKFIDLLKHEAIHLQNAKQSENINPILAIKSEPDDPAVDENPCDSGIETHDKKNEDDIIPKLEPEVSTSTSESVFAEEDVKAINLDEHLSPITPGDQEIRDLPKRTNRKKSRKRNTVENAHPPPSSSTRKAIKIKKKVGKRNPAAKGNTKSDSSNPRAEFYEMKRKFDWEKEFEIAPNTSNTSKTHYKCKRCEKLISCREKLIFHTFIHTGVEPFSCRYCQRRFRNPTIWRYHENLHTNSLPFKCRECPTSFNNPGSCRRHERIFHPSSNLTSRLKGSVENGLKIPNPTDSSGLVKLRFTRNVKIFLKRVDEDEEHSKVYREAVSRMNIKKSVKSEIKSNQRSLTILDIPKYFKTLKDGRCECLQCHKVIKKKSIYGHHYAHLDKFNCRFCNRIFTRMQILKNHENRVHLGMKTPKRPCRFCGRLINKDHLRDHEDIHQGIKRYTCPKSSCTLRFARKSIQYYRHLKAHRKNEDIPKNVKRSRSNVNPKLKDNKRMESVDENSANQRDKNSNVKIEDITQYFQRLNDGKWKCLQCQREMQKNSRRIHHLAHTGQFPCRFCNQIFKRIDHCTRHEKRVHLRKMPKLTKECNSSPEDKTSIPTSQEELNETPNQMEIKTENIEDPDTNDFTFDDEDLFKLDMALGTFF